MFRRLQHAGLKLKPNKYYFARKEVRYLGHIVTVEGVKPNPTKTEAVSTYPVPQDDHELRQFLGLANYYRRFVKDYSRIAESLHQLTRKTSKGFQWTPSCQEAFEELKDRLTTPPILDFSQEFILHTDASATALGAVLCQAQNGQERVISYWSRQLSKPERNYSTIEREALAAVAAIKEFYPYLYGFSFTLVTDHNPLTALKSLKDVGDRLARWMMFLQQFQLKIEYKPGKDHSDADALSRRPSGSGGGGDGDGNVGSSGGGGDGEGNVGSSGGEGSGSDGERNMGSSGGEGGGGDGEGNLGSSGGEGGGGDGEGNLGSSGGEGGGGDGDGILGSSGGEGGGGDGDGNVGSSGGEGGGGDGDGNVGSSGGCITLVSTLQPTFLNTTDIKSEQQKDKDLKPLLEQIQAGLPVPSSTRPGLRKCLLVDGVLCRKYMEHGMTPRTQIVIPSSLQDTVLKQLHDLFGDLGIRKTMGKVKERFYWPGYEHDVELHVQECGKCQRCNPPQPQPTAPLETIKATHPFEKVSWDIMGPLPTTESGNKYILVVTDLFTKWVEAFALQETSSTTLATVLVDQVISRFGVPNVLHSDQGANLCSAVIKAVCHLLLLGMGKTRTSAYHPQGNGQVERFNRTVEAILAKTVKDNQRDWDLCLQKALFAYRTSLHKTTGFTPFHLVFGRTPKLPIDVMLERMEEADFQDYPPFVQGLHSKLKCAFGQTRGKLSTSHKHQKRFYDRGSRGSELEVGDRVWLYVPAVKPGKTKKLSSLWRGPYTVLDKTSPVNYCIQLIGGTASVTVHRNQLKL